MKSSANYNAHVSDLDAGEFFRGGGIPRVAAIQSLGNICKGYWQNSGLP